MKKGLTAFVFIQTESGGGFNAAVLARLPEVEELHRVAGEDCYVLRVRAANTRELGRLVSDKIERIGAVCSTRTTLVLKTFKEGAARQLEKRQARAATGSPS